MTVTFVIIIDIGAFAVSVVAVALHSQDIIPDLISSTGHRGVTGKGKTIGNSIRGN